MALQLDGKIVLTGSTPASSQDVQLVRYEADGTLDTTFGDNGFVTTGIGTAGDVSYKVRVQGDGKIVVVGYSFNGVLLQYLFLREE